MTPCFNSKNLTDFISLFFVMMQFLELKHTTFYSGCIIKISLSSRWENLCYEIQLCLTIMDMSN